MKTIKVVTTLVVLLFAVQFSFAQTTEYSVANYEVNITNNQAKTTIEKAFDKTEGVQSANVDVTSKIVKIKYDEKVISTKEIEKIIQDAGYTTKAVNVKSSDKKQNGHKCNSPCNHRCNH